MIKSDQCTLRTSHSIFSFDSGVLVDLEVELSGVAGGLSGVAGGLSGVAGGLSGVAGGLSGVAGGLSGVAGC